jgi:hypothetical protein
VQVSRSHDIVRIVLDPGLRYETMDDVSSEFWQGVEESLRSVSFTSSAPTIFLLCNFVYHRRPSESTNQFRAKTTNAAVLAPLLAAIFSVFGPAARVRIGNAPLQSANWGAMLAETGLDALMQLSARKPGWGIVEACDLRANIQERNALGWTTRSAVAGDGDKEIVQIDLGANSVLEEHRSGTAQYRVLDYATRRTDACHGPGKHVYLLNGKILEADLIISVPKLKTHEKVGMTAALKGCVGAVAHKDCLAHHRKGSAARGGDEYPDGRSMLRDASTAFHEWVYARRDGPVSRVLRVADRAVRKTFVLGGGVAHGSWPGNDTAWRMSLDLARILAHGRSDGSMSDDAVRPHFVLTDGIIAGEGQGPLDVDPVPLGYLSWAEDPAAADTVNAAMMGIPVDVLRIVHRAFDIDRYPITPLAGPGEVTVAMNGEAGVSIPTAIPNARPFRMPRGW